MANLIQIKRSQNTATPTSLANGELAYSSNGNVLYIGDFGSIVAIGGERNPGVLTANQALIANSTSYIDVVKTANLYIGTSTVNAINAIANVTHLGANANNELPTTWAVKTYVDSSIAYTITNNSSNTQLLFNDSGIVAGDAGITYDKTTDTLLVAGTLNVNNSVYANGSGVTVTGYVNATSSVNASMLSVGTNFIANTTGAYHTGTVNALSFTIGSDTVANTTGVYTTGTVNGSAVSVGTNFIANSSQITSAVPVVFNANVSLGDASTDRVTITGLINSDVQPSSNLTYSLGTTGLRWLNVYASNGYFAALDVSGSVAVGDNVTVSNNVVVNNNVNAASFTVGSSVVSNTTGVFTTGTVNAATLSVDNIFVANSTGVLANTDVTINGNTTIGSGSSDTVSVLAEVSSNLIPSANVTYNIGDITDRWNYVYAANVHSTQGYFEGNVQIAGDLIVQGNVTTQNVSSLEVQDPLIYLAGNNYASDLVDIGFVGNYFDGTTNRHAGVIRHAATDQFYMFKGYTAEPDNNVIDIGNTSLGYVQGTLNAFLETGKGFRANSSAVYITANSTVEVSITANSITLSTPLAATSGGTGYNSYTSGDLLVANSGNSLSKLGLGADGLVLQSNGSALVYSSLDGGIF